MKTKLTHRFFVKALAVGLFTAIVIGAAACLFLLALLSLYQLYDHNMFEPWLAETAVRFASSEGTLYAVLIALIVTGIALFVFLMCAAGKREGHEGTVLSRFDRIPFDILLALSVIALAAILLALQSLFYYSSTINFEKPLLLPIGAAIAVATLIVLMLCMTFAARVKTGTFWSNNIIAFVVVFLWRGIKWIGRGMRTLYRNAGILWKAVLVYFALEIILLFAFRPLFSNPYSPAPFLLLWIAGLAAVCMITLQLRRLEKGALALAQGHVEARIDTKHMLPTLKKHAENLNSIADGMNHAVEARMKSERMKTDLITNVSHDLKTPLTSIINYIDLLQKEPEGENAKEYLDVLARQAQKLKKLTTDVVEASKASSGALLATLEPTDAAELMHQSMAEYSERFAAAALTPQVKAQDGLKNILADGRLLWRVLDNLLSNVVKYSLPSTRVYCEAQNAGDKVLITIKNISREPLNAPLDELTERFTRGDASRASEGSGLGLSIAKSLTELQHGSLSLSADGDLFKAELRFPVV